MSLKYFLYVVLIIFFLAPVALAQQGVSLMAKEAWKFGNGSEFPGATGSLAIDPSAQRDGKESLKLQGDFTKGGNYTAAAMKSPYNIPYKAFEWKVKATQCGCPVVRYERWDHCWTPTCGRNWRKDDAKSGMLVSGGV
jgi:hypothetical protein